MEITTGERHEWNDYTLNDLHIKSLREGMEMDEIYEKQVLDGEEDGNGLMKRYVDFKLLIPNSSTSKFSFAFGGITGGKPREP